jgi:hypothetical protein
MKTLCSLAHAIAQEVLEQLCAQVVSLASDLLRGLTLDFASGATLVFGSVEAALLASQKVQNAVVALEDLPDEPLVGPLVIVGPSTQQVRACACCMAVLNAAYCCARQA